MSTNQLDYKDLANIDAQPLGYVGKVYRPAHMSLKDFKGRVNSNLFRIRTANPGVYFDWVMDGASCMLIEKVSAAPPRKSTSGLRCVKSKPKKVKTKPLKTVGVKPTLKATVMEYQLWREALDTSYKLFPTVSGASHIRFADDVLSGYRVTFAGGIDDRLSKSSGA